MVSGLRRIFWLAAAAMLGIDGTTGSAALAQNPAPALLPGFREFAEKQAESPRIVLSDDGQTLYVTGTLLQGSYLRLAEAARAAPNLRTVYLASYGGLTVEGRLIGLFIRNHGLDTYVEHVCASACTMAFIAGRQRVLGPEGVIGFHQGFMVTDKGTVEMSQDQDPDYKAERGFAPVVGISGTAEMRLAYERAGLGSALIAKALSTPSQTMWYPGLEELREGRVFTRSAAVPELPPPPGLGRSRDDIDRDLAAFPLWSSLKSYAPAQYDSAALDVWRGINTGLLPTVARWKGRTGITGFAQGELRAAPDGLLDRAVLLYGEIARSERARDYPGCSTQVELQPRAPGPEDAAFAAREDVLLAELFANPARAPVPPPEQALKDFRKLAGKIARNGRFDMWSGEGSEHECRLGLQTLEAMSALDPKRRVKAYRALLALPPDDTPENENRAQ